MESIQGTPIDPVEVSAENHPYHSKIALRFFRHDKKETAAPGQTDQKVRLTAEGRKHAQSLAGETDLDQAMAFASPRERTQETAAFIMAGKSDDITGDESLDTLRVKLDGGKDHGSKIAVDPRLDFNLEADNAFVKAFYAAYKKGETMSFLVHESDKLAAEVGDNESSTYSRMAANVASIILKYCKVAARWDQLVSDPAKEYKPELERFFGTHACIQESFLAKVIELTRGETERDAFAASIPQGFDYAEGFTLDIATKVSGESPAIRISYKKGDFVLEENLSKDLLEKIVEGGK